jgi:hypothetical protein
MQKQGLHVDDRVGCIAIVKGTSSFVAGPVENSEAGMASDAPILEAELDLDLLCSGNSSDEL